MDPLAPLTMKLKEVPQYDRELDLKEFLHKYEGAVEPNGGSSAIKAKAFVMAVKGAAQS